MQGMRVVGIAASCALLLSCRDSQGHSVLPTVRIEGGIEIAAPPILPDLRAPEHEWSLRIVRNINTVPWDGDEPLVFNPRAAQLLASGDLMVFDPSADRPLVVLDPLEGVVVTRFGRSGNGPGELGSDIAFREGDSGLLVIDASNRHVHHFSLTGTLLESTPFSIDVRGGDPREAPMSGDFLIETFRRSGQEWHRELEQVDGASGTARPFARLPDPEPGAEAGHIQEGRDLWAVVGPHVATMWSSRPVVYIHGSDGALVREIRLPLTRRSLAKETSRPKSRSTDRSPVS